MKISNIAPIISYSPSFQLAHLRERYQDLEERLTLEQQLKATAASAIPTIDSRGAPDQSRRDEEEIRRLQLELVRLTTELTGAQGQLSSLERRLDGALRGRLRYKDLWSRALQEVTRLRQEAANATKQELQRKEAEVEGLRREQCLLLRAGDTRLCQTLHNAPVQVNGGHAQRLVVYFCKCCCLIPIDWLEISICGIGNSSSRINRFLKSLPMKR